LTGKKEGSRFNFCPKKRASLGAEREGGSSRCGKDLRRGKKGVEKGSVPWREKKEDALNWTGGGGGLLN